MSKKGEPLPERPRPASAIAYEKKLKRRAAAASKKGRR